VVMELAIATSLLSFTMTEVPVFQAILFCPGCQPDSANSDNIWLVDIVSIYSDITTAGRRIRSDSHFLVFLVRCAHCQQKDKQLIDTRGRAILKEWMVGDSLPFNRVQARYRPLLRCLQDSLEKYAAEIVDFRSIDFMISFIVEVYDGNSLFHRILTSHPISIFREEDSCVSTYP
jgi:hypothetical protein